MRTSVRNKLSLLCYLASFIAFVPGISLAMLKISTRGSVESELANLQVEFFNTSNSILNTVHDLFIHHNKFVACMVFLFSIIIPFVKAVLFSYVILTTNPIRKQIFNFVKSISKWAMNDVFIVAVFLAYLSTGSSNKESVHETTILGVPMDIDVFVHMNAKLETGFYFFLAYCLLSLIAFQLYNEDEFK